MGLFGFHPEKKLAKATEHLEKGYFYDARIAFEELLGREGIEEGIRAQAKEGWRRARAAMAETQLQEAKALLAAGEGSQAIESLHASILMAGDDIEAGEARILLAGLEVAESSDEPLLQSLEDLPPAPAPPPEDDGEGDRFGENPDDLLEVYLSPFSHELAERYRRLGTEFRDGYILLQQGDIEGAKQHLDVVPPEWSEDGILKLEKAQIALIEKRDQDALDLLGEVDIPAEAARRRAEMAAVLLDRLGRAPEAEREARGVFESNPKDPDAGALYGEILLGHGRYEEALATVKPFLKLPDPPPELPYLAAKAYAGLGRTGEARDLLEQEVETFFQGPGRGRMPRFPLAAARELYQLYISTNEEPTKVRSMAQHLIAFDPGSTGEYKEALARYAQARSTHGEDPASKE